MAVVELLTAVKHTQKARRALEAMKWAIQSAGDTVIETTSYQGCGDWLMLWGVGAAAHNQARNAQRAAGKKSLLLDMGYTNRGETWRFSIDDDHPHRLFDATPEDRAPIAEMKDWYSPNGHIIIAALGLKSKKYLGLHHWERTTFKRLKQEFPKRRIFIKEKKDETPFENLLFGASLVVARHSNCCIDAAIHNIPFRCTDGAAYWLKDMRDRERFLRKLSCWQSTPDQAKDAWDFIRRISK